jgi:hypothetical protein
MSRNDLFLILVFPGPVSGPQIGADHETDGHPVHPGRLKPAFGLPAGIKKPPACFRMPVISLLIWTGTINLSD